MEQVEQARRLVQYLRDTNFYLPIDMRELIIRSMEYLIREVEEKQTEAE